MSIISFNESIQKGEYKKAASDRPERRSCLKSKDCIIYMSDVTGKKLRWTVPHTLCR
jgi:hypothetical protein